MQPVPRRESPEPSRTQPAKLRIRKTTSELVIEILTSVRFWGGLSVLAVLVSLAQPWWGVTVDPINGSSYWGLFFGPGTQSQQPNIIFFPDRLDTALAANYVGMTVLVILTGLSTLIGAAWKKTGVLAISLTLSVITILSFLADVENAVGINCARASLGGASCISGLVGQGISGIAFVAWGFQAGFYTFIVSVVLLIGTLALHESKSRYNSQYN